MEVGRLELTDFRNYSTAEVEFDHGLNLIVGGNGQGKTNLLEAIYVVSALGSHRSSSFGPLVGQGADRAIVRVGGTANKRDLRVDAEIRASGGMRLLVNKVAMRGSEAVAAGFAAVIFSPEDLSLIKEGPDGRRRFVDQAAGQMRPLAGAARQEFERVLRQRNAALKAASYGGNPQALDAWDEQFVKASTAVVSARLELLNELAPRTHAHYRRLSQSDVQPELLYRASWTEAVGFDPVEVEGLLRSAVGASRPREIERGMSLVGPQRDDVDVRLDGAEARSFASQGEQRSLALSLRLSQRDLLMQSRGEDPILLLDDVFSELDEGRRGQLGELVAGAGQVLATSTSAAEVPGMHARTYVVERGKIRSGD